LGKKEIKGAKGDKKTIDTDSKTLGDGVAAKED